MSESISTMRVRYAETDQMGVVYHANYLIWCEVGRTDFIRSIGRPYAELERDGVLLAVADVSMRFLASARYDDSIHVFTRLTQLRSRAMTFSYRILNADTQQLLVTASTSLISLSPDNRPASIPVGLRAQLMDALTPETTSIT